MAGLLIALMTGMLSGYLLATVVYFGSRALTRLRSAGERREDRLLDG